MATTRRPRALVVASDPALADRVVEWLSSQGHEPHLCTDFLSAKAAYDACPPDLLVTQIELGAFNGLQLAVRAMWRRTSTIVIGKNDPILEAEARRHQAQYLPEPLNEEVFGETARALLPGARL